MALADKQTFNRVAGTVEAKMVSWLAAMLTDTISMPTDGPFITADNDGAGKSPVNVGLKDFANLITGLAGSLYGNVVGISQRSLKSFYIDGTGGVIHTVASGYGQALTALLVGATGAIRAQLDTAKLAFTGTVASGSNPAKTAAGANTLDALMIPKAWAWWSTDGVGGITLNDGGRIASATIVGTNVRLTFASSFDNATYATIVHCENVTGGSAFDPLIIENSAWVELDTNALDPATTVMKGRVVIFGRITT